MTHYYLRWLAPIVQIPAGALVIEQHEDYMYLPINIPVILHTSPPYTFRRHRAGDPLTTALPLDIMR